MSDVTKIMPEVHFSDRISHISCRISFERDLCGISTVLPNDISVLQFISCFPVLQIKSSICLAITGNRTGSRTNDYLYLSLVGRNSEQVQTVNLIANQTEKK